MKEIIPLYKPQGATPLEVIRQFCKQFPAYAAEKISVAGRLDPMADGLLLLLVGDANKDRHIYQDLEKSYDFTLLFGITTDTYDCLGKITSLDFSCSSEDINHGIRRILLQLRGTHRQNYPPYSSMHVNGKPLFSWAREGKLNTLTIPSKEITIKNLELTSCKNKDKKELFADIQKRIKQVRGDFRQSEILLDWEFLKTHSPERFVLASCTATVTSGTYIRTLCHSIGEKLECGALAYAITRTALGEYNLSDALILNK